MTGTKISLATDATSLVATDKLPIARESDSTPYYVLASYIAAYVISQITGLVPYSGADSDVDIGAHDFMARNINATLDCGTF